jgi:hypothetical protein
MAAALHSVDLDRTHALPAGRPKKQTSVVCEGPDRNVEEAHALIVRRMRGAMPRTARQ